MSTLTSNPILMHGNSIYISRKRHMDLSFLFYILLICRVGYCYLLLWYHPSLPFHCCIDFNCCDHCIERIPLIDCTPLINCAPTSDRTASDSLIVLQIIHGSRCKPSINRSSSDHFIACDVAIISSLVIIASHFIICDCLITFDCFCCLQSFQQL